MHGSATVRLVPKLPANYVTLQQLKERREQELQRRKEEEELKKKQKEEEEREAARKKEEQERKLKEEEAARQREEEERKHEEAPPNSSEPINRSVAAVRIHQRARGGRAYLRTVHNARENSGAAHTTPVNDFSSRNGQRQKELSGTMIRNATTMPDRMQNKVVSRIGTSQQSISTETNEEEENKEVMPIVAIAENPKFVTRCAEQRNRNFDKHLLQNPPPDSEAGGVTDKRSHWWKEKKKLVEKDFGKRKIVNNENEDPRCVCPFREIDKSVESVSACTPKEERYDKKKNKRKHRKRYNKKKGALNSEDRPAVYEDNEMLGAEGDPAKDSGYSPAGNRRETSAVGVVELTGHGGGNGSFGDEKEKEVSVRMMQKGMGEMTIHSTGASDRHSSRRGVSINKRNGEPRRGGRLAGDLRNTKPTEPIEILKTQIAEERVVQEEKEEDIVKATQRDREDTRVSFNGRGRGRGFSGYGNRGNGFQRFGDRRLMNRNYGLRFSVKWMKKEDLR